MLQEQLPPLLTDPRNGIQLGDYHGFPSQFSVERDRITVNLILNPLQQIKLLAVSWKGNRLGRISHHQLGCPVLGILDKSAYRNEQAQFILQHIYRCRNLSFASIDDNHIGTRQIFLQHPFIPAPDHLAHRLIVIRTLYRSNLVFPILLLRGLAINKDNHSRYRVGSLNIGIIECLNP